MSDHLPVIGGNMQKCSCGTVALMVLGQFSDMQISENWPRTIRAMVPQLAKMLIKCHQNVTV